MATGAVGQNIFYPFDPKSIDGCNLWLDAADPNGTGTPPTNGTTLTTWKDKSVSNFPFTSAGSIYSTTAVNALPGISLSTNFFGYDPGSAQNNWQEVFAVGLWTGGSTFDSYNGLVTSSVDSDGGSGGGIIFIGNIGSTNWYPIGNTYTTPVLNGIQTYTALPTIQNPFVVRTFSATAVNLRGLRFGVDRSNGRIWLGFISEVISYNIPLSTTQRQQVEGYLAWKWGTQGVLVGSNPYKTAAPQALPTLNSAQVGTIQLYIIKNRSFTPPQIKGLALWFDAQDPYANGSRPGNGTLTTWNDKSSNANNATASAGGVTYNTTNLGGYPAFIFTNSQYLLGTTSITGSNLAIFSVFSLANQSVGNAGRIIALAASGQNDYNNNSYMGLLRQGGLSFGPYRNGTYTGNTLSAYDTPTIMEAWYDGTFQYSVTNGGITPLSNASTGNFSISAYALADNTNLGDVPNGPIYGSLGEVIVYSTTPSLPQRQLVEGYLAWKWGLRASLPPTHPYKNYNIYANPFPSVPVQQTSSQKAIFKPTNYAGCQLWLDAFDPFGNGSRQKSPLTLTSWADKSTNARNATMFNGTNITYSPNAFNNRPALLFTQTQNMSSAAVAGTFPSAFTFFMIYQRTGGGTFDTLVTRTVGNLAAPLDLYTIISSGNFVRAVGNGTAYSSYNTTSGSNFTNVTTPSLYYANATAATGLLDAFNFATPTDPSSGSLTGVYYGDTATGIYIGTRADSLTTLTASVAEVIVYSTTPSDQQRQQIEGYLAWKWGLQANLPAGHPYKNYPPPPQ
jgi:hypothetical protein